MRLLTITLLVTGPALGLAGCGSDSTTGPNAGTVLESVSPAAGATGVDPAAPITVRFSGPMANGMEQYVDVHQGGINGPVVPMTCAFSADRATLTCTHNQLQGGTGYTIHMGSGMMDGSGHPVEVESHGMAMGGQVVTGGMMGGMHDGEPIGMMGEGWHHSGDDHLGMAFTFQTGPGGQPSGATVLESVSPGAGATGVDPAAPITIHFSGPMANGMEQYVDVHQGDISGPIVPMTCTFSADRTTLTCAHAQPLQPGTGYTIHMGSGMMDGTGHQVEVESHGMAMGGQPVTGQMMGGMHGGQPMGMMGQGWHHAGDDHLGMAFTFQTA